MYFLSFLAAAGCKAIINNKESRILFLSIFVLLSSIPAFSQNVFPSTGNVGIGTIIPSQKLDIEDGNIIVGNNYGLIFRNNADANDGTKIHRRSGNALSLSYTGNFLRFDALDDNPVIFRNSTDETKVQIHPAGHSWFMSENVGIGTTNPARKLHVFGDVRVQKNIGQITSGNHWQTGNHTLELYGTGGSDIVLSFHRAGLNAGVIKFAEKDGVTGLTLSANDAINTNQLFLKRDGNVGIGNPSPSMKLQIAGSVASGNNNVMSLDNNEWFNFTNVSGYGAINWFSQANASNTDFHNTHATVKASSIRGGNGEIRFFTSSNNMGIGQASQLTQRMVIDDHGNVGIGASAPQAKLHVIGDGMIESYSPLLKLRRDSDIGGFIQGIQTQLKDGSPNFYFGNLHSDQWIISKGEYDGQRLLTVKTDGNVGIGTTNPGSKLSVAGDISVTTQSFVKFGQTYSKVYEDSGDRLIVQGHNGLMLQSYNGTQGTLYTDLFARYGKIGIGTTAPTQKLSVNGKINAEEIILEDVDGADFVFEEDYDLRSLEETEQFIKANKHLPEIPSAAEMAEEGLAIKEMNILLLQKVEELTLHLIQKDKEVKDLQSEMLQMKKQLEHTQEVISGLTTER